MVGYLYGGNTGVKTAAELQREREIVDALIARGQKTPQNLGEGLSVLGQAIANRVKEGRLRKDEAAGKAAGSSLLADLFKQTDSPTITPQSEIETGPLNGGMSPYNPEPSLAGTPYPINGPETPPGPEDWQQGEPMPAPEPMASPIPEPMPTAQTSFPKTTNNLENMSADQLTRFMADPRFEHMPKVVQEMVAGRYKTLADPMNALQVEESKLKIENLKNPKLTPAEEANLAFQREKFEYEKAKGDPNWAKLTDGSLFNQQTGEVKQVPGGAPIVDFKDINAVRKEVQDTPQVKNYMQAAPIYRSMVETAPRSTRASDLNLVYGLGKIFDPTSVVREGEMVMVKNTASLPDWYQQAVSVFNGASGLTPELRAKIMDEAKSRMAAYRAETESLKQQYEGLSQRHGLNMDDIWQPLPVLPDYVPSATDDGWKVLPNGVKIRKKAQ
jgi:hypothetical protein